MNSDKLVIGIVSTITILVFGFIAYNAFSKNNISTSESTPENVIGSNPHVKGANLEDSKVVVVEFSDFECPACQTVFPVVSSIASRYENDVSVIYRHFPLPSHRSAIPMAKASEAAALQGKFWEFHDELFSSPGRYTMDDFLSYADKLSLDLDKFQSDMNSKEVTDRVNEDLSSAQNLNLNGTPTFFIIYNGKVEQVVINRSFDELETAITNALNEVNGTSEMNNASEESSAPAEDMPATSEITGEEETNPLNEDQ